MKINLADYAFYQKGADRSRRPIVWAAQAPWAVTSFSYQAIEPYGTLRFIIPRSTVVATDYVGAMEMMLEALKEYTPYDYAVAPYADPAAGFLMGTLFEVLGFNTKPVQWLRYERGVDGDTGARKGGGFYMSSTFRLDFEVDDSGVIDDTAEEGARKILSSP